MDKILDCLANASFYQVAVISIGLFFADFIAGITASLFAGNRIMSGIMQEGLSRKMTGYFYHLVVGLAFYLASMNGGSVVSVSLNKIGQAIIILPAIPEILSIYENWQSITSKRDKK